MRVVIPLVLCALALTPLLPGAERAINPGDVPDAVRAQFNKTSGGEPLIGTWVANDGGAKTYVATFRNHTTDAVETIRVAEDGTVTHDLRPQAPVTPPESVTPPSGTQSPAPTAPTHPGPIELKPAPPAGPGPGTQGGSSAK